MVLRVRFIEWERLRVEQTLDQILPTWVEGGMSSIEIDYDDYPHARGHEKDVVEDDDGVFRYRENKVATPTTRRRLSFSRKGYRLNSTAWIRRNWKKI